MTKHSKYTPFRKCKVNETKIGGYIPSKRYTITFPKDYAENDEVFEGTFIYNPFDKTIVFRKK